MCKISWYLGFSNDVSLNHIIINFSDVYIRRQVDRETKINPRKPEEVPDRWPKQMPRGISIRKRLWGELPVYPDSLFSQLFRQPFWPFRNKCMYPPLISMYPPLISMYPPLISICVFIEVYFYKIWFSSKQKTPGFY